MTPELISDPIFVDPSPCSLRYMGDEEMHAVVGGNPIAVVIITCSSALGTRTITTVGVAVITIADP